VQDVWTVYLSGEIHTDWRDRIMSASTESEYKQWNAAFDAGQCAALGKPYITLHDADIIHPLKEVDGQAMGWAQTPEQVVEVLAYVTGPVDASA